MASTSGEMSGILGVIERVGNKLPDPVFLFGYFILGLIVISVLCAIFGVSAQLDAQVLAGMGPASLERFAIGADGVIAAQSLLSAQNIQRLLVEMPKTFTHFHPLGYVLVVMLGAGVAERAGLLTTAMRGAVQGAPVSLLTPVVAIVAMLGNHAADAAYVVLIPLAGTLYAAAGRHPLAGIATGFAAVSGGFSANLAPGQLDALLFGITEQAGEMLVPSYDANIAGNWWFILVLMFIYTPIIWLVTDKFIEPKLGAYQGGAGTPSVQGDRAPLSLQEKKGLRRAGIAALVVLMIWGALIFLPGTPLLADEGSAADNPAVLQMSPLFQSLVAMSFVLFLAAGWAYGACVGTIKTHRDLVAMMSDAMKDLGYYLVLAFASAHFVALFAWSNLGLITAIGGADLIERSGLPLAALLAVIVIFSGVINLIVGSASAKWALLAPVLVPMLMLLGVSPEGTTAAYRVGDSATNIMTPLMVYFPLVLVYCRRWQPQFGLGSLTALMIPYSVWLLIAGVLLVVVWALGGLPLGPGASFAWSF